YDAVRQRYLNPKQRSVLLRAVHVAITDRPRPDRTDEGGLDGPTRIELDKVRNLIRPEPVETSNQLGRDDLTGLHRLVGPIVLEQHVDSQPEGAGVLAANDGHQFSNVDRFHRAPTSSQLIGNGSHGSSTFIRW